MTRCSDRTHFGSGEAFRPDIIAQPRLHSQGFTKFLPDFQISLVTFGFEGLIIVAANGNFN